MILREDSISVHSDNFAGRTVWDKKIASKDIPGTTVVPVAELANYFQGNFSGLFGLDLGSGSGRSTDQITTGLPGSKVAAIDLSLDGLRTTDAASHRFQASALEIPFRNDTFDFVSICGVFTNLVSDDSSLAIGLRVRAVQELHRTIKTGGCVVISDFGAEHKIDKYLVNYRRHALITGEIGTIAVLRSGVSFANKTDDEIIAMKGTDDVIRYAHHYFPSELKSLLQSSGFRVRTTSIGLTKTPSGIPIENIVMLASK
jgi:SAM-dependent methyltransferase